MGGEPSKILPGLYLGGSNVIDNYDQDWSNWWTDKGITHCVSICDISPPDHVIPADKKMWINVPDIPGTNLGMYFDRVVDFVHGARVGNGVVYIHCAAGISRSTTMTVAYLMAALRLDFNAALAFVITKRECACPNDGFRRQLRQFQDGSVEFCSKQLEEKYPEGSNLVQADLQEVHDSHNALQNSEIENPYGDTVLPAPKIGANAAGLFKSVKGRLIPVDADNHAAHLLAQEDKVRRMLQPLKDSGQRAGGSVGLEWLDTEGDLANDKTKACKDDGIESTEKGENKC